MVGLPDTENRERILRVILAQEELEDGFDFKELASCTEGYSGSDLKVGSEMGLGAAPFIPLFLRHSHCAAQKQLLPCQS